MRPYLLTAAVAVTLGRGADAAAPAVDGVPQVVRRIPQGYMVTPTAVVPIAVTARDDGGLGRVTFVVAAAPLVAGKAGPEEPEQRVPVSGFDRLLRQRGGAPTPLIKEFQTAGDDPSSALDLAKLPRPLRGADKDEPSPRHRLRVRLEVGGAGPGTPPVRSEPVTLVVVSELELLSEVANEEEAVHLVLHGRALRGLREARLRLRQLNATWSSPLGHPPKLRDPADDIRRAVEKAAADARDVRADYRRIVRELKTNRVRDDMVDRVEKKISEPLGEALRGEFDRSLKALTEWRDRLEAGDGVAAGKAGVAAGEMLDAAVGRLDNVCRATRELDDANRLIKQLRDVEALIFDRR